MTENVCPFIDPEKMECRASMWNSGRKRPNAYRPLNSREIELCTSTAHLECPDYKANMPKVVSE